MFWSKFATELIVAILLLSNFLWMWVCLKYFTKWKICKNYWNNYIFNQKIVYIKLIILKKYLHSFVIWNITNHIIPNAVMILGWRSLNKQIFWTWKGIEQMQKRVLSFLIIIIVLIITGCTSSSGNRGNVGLFGSWAKNSPSFSKPSIWQCAWGEENHYQNKKCD